MLGVTEGGLALEDAKGDVLADVLGVVGTDEGNAELVDGGADVGPEFVERW
jgi:hypothetical protein